MSKPAAHALEKKKVAIIGGGCAALTTAFELSRPELQNRYEITIYQLGWRLGGKGASGRDATGRIEEHGLHLWMGFYENAFRLMRECYAEAGRDPATCPLATWEQAFIPDDLSGIADYSPSGKWLPWLVTFPPLAGLPGDPPVEAREWSMRSYLGRAFVLLTTLIETISVRLSAPSASPPPGQARTRGHVRGDVAGDVARMLRMGHLATLGGALEALHIMSAAIGAMPKASESMLLQLHDMVDRAVRAQLEELVRRDDEVRRLWEIVDLCLALVRGVLRFRLITDPNGFDAINDYDCREWLKMNGASDRAINSGFLRALYDLGFSYENGDPLKPRVAAGQAVRGAVRAFFTYRGSFFYKMAAGMGDVVFSPLYEVLKRRGVRFEFFHRLENVCVEPASEGERPHIRAIEIDVQAELKNGGEYAPLIDVQGLACWPSAPDWTQLANGEQQRHEGWDFESHWDRRCVAKKTLLAGEDFDFVVLGVGVGAVEHVAKELVTHSARWREAVTRGKSVATQAVQLWLNEDTAALGWKHGPVNLSGYVEPFDTWADMTHLIAMEGHEQHARSLDGAEHKPVRAIAYLVNTLPDAQIGDPQAQDAPQRALAEVVRNTEQFLERDIAVLWPNAVDKEGGFRWQVLEPTGPARAEHCALRGPARLASQYVRANINPSDRYALSLPGSLRYRLSPLDHDFDNLTVTGDWTNCGFNEGCVEAAVMSGLLAAHAIAESPKLEDIIGFDHP